MCRHLPVGGGTYVFDPFKHIKAGIQPLQFPCCSQVACHDVQTKTDSFGELFCYKHKLMTAQKFSPFFLAIIISLIKNKLKKPDRFFERFPGNNIYNGLKTSSSATSEMECAALLEENGSSKIMIFFWPRRRASVLFVPRLFLTRGYSFLQ